MSGAPRDGRYDETKIKKETKDINKKAKIIDISMLRNKKQNK